MDPRQYTEGFELRSIIPADGWRAVYIQPEQPRGIWLGPLVCWGVFEYLAEDGRISRAVSGLALVGSGGAIDRVDGTETFWMYLAPGGDEPDDASIAAGTRRQKAKAASSASSALLG